MVDLAELSTRFTNFGRHWRRVAPLYARLADAIADDEEVMALLHAAPEQQQIPVLLFAAVHDLLLRGGNSELAAFYPNLTTMPRTDIDPYPLFRDAVLSSEAILRTTISTRNTQTNEIGRCCYLLPAFAIVADEVGPLAHIDIGASAGLNLGWNNYSYSYLPGGDVAIGSTVVLKCSTRGDPPIPTALPALAFSVGLDVKPIDVTDDDAVRWLEACVWPDQPERFARLVAAITLARVAPPDVRRGDAVADVGGLITEAAAFGHPVVTTSWVLSYLPIEQQRAFVDAMDDAAQHRDLSWIVAESPVETPGLPIPSRPGEELTVVSLISWRAGKRSIRRLATSHPHGAFITWEAPTDVASRQLS